MKIFYVIYNDWTIQQKLKLKELGTKVDEGFDRLDIEEKDSNKEALKLLSDWGLIKDVNIATVYEKKDFLNRRLYIYTGTWSNGYPMPDDDGGFMNLTYDLHEYCEVCDIGKIQKAPFRIKKVPKWDNKMMFDLEWIHDEIFVRKELYDKLFKRIGVESWPVLLHKKDSVIENTLQLKIPVIDIPLILNDQPFEVCQVCGKKKYFPRFKGLGPSFKEFPDKFQIFKCREYFGSGGEARNYIFISKKLFNEFKALNIKPDLIPVE